MITKKQVLKRFYDLSKGLEIIKIKTSYGYLFTSVAGYSVELHYSDSYTMNSMLVQGDRIILTSYK